MFSIGSLFSGIGGIELGLEKSGGFKTEWFVEKEPYCQAVLKKHWPKTPIYSDITTVKWEEVKRVDVLTGGFPCQDISYAGKGAGIKGSRSGLWKEYYEAIRQIRPRLVLVENVSALLNRGLDVVLADLATLGYDAEWHCITASSIGAPHRRDRIFIIAYPSKQRLHREENKQELEGERSSELQLSQSRNSKDMAYSNDSRHLHRQTQKQPAEAGQYAQRQPISSSSDVPNTNSLSMEKRRTERKQVFRTSTSKEELQRYSQTIGRKQWSVEPNVGGTLDGFSSYLDDD